MSKGRYGGYRRICIDYEIYLAHRLVWKHVNGSEPPDDLDHRDGDPGNNRIENLREATPEGNARNVGAWRKRTLPKGVYERGGRYRVRIGVGYKTIGAGTFDTIDEARDAYTALAKRLHGEFARAA